MVELYLVHAIMQFFAFLFILSAVYSARKHKLKWHHRLNLVTVILMTLAISIMVYSAGGLPALHGKLGIIVYIYIIGTALSGCAFSKRKIKRTIHQAIAITAVVLFILQIISGILKVIQLY